MGNLALAYRRGIEAALDVTFPPRCAACGCGVESGRGALFCPDCDAEVTRFSGPVCDRCCYPQPGEAAEFAPCPICRDERWAFDRAVALGPYEGLLRRLVLEGKGRRGERALRALGRLLGEEVLAGDLGRDAVVVPVPSHWTRRQVRGCDPARTLAEAAASAAGLPLNRQLRRPRKTARQTEVTRSARLTNPRAAFAVSGDPSLLAGRAVLLVDDVFTTGATCHHAARALRKAGAARIVAVTAAKSIDWE